MRIVDDKNLVKPGMLLQALESYAIYDEPFNPGGFQSLTSSVGAIEAGQNIFILEATVHEHDGKTTLDFKVLHNGTVGYVTAAIESGPKLAILEETS